MLVAERGEGVQVLVAEEVVRVQLLEEIPDRSASHCDAQQWKDPLRKPEGSRRRVENDAADKVRSAAASSNSSTIECTGRPKAAQG